jgi:uracil-DNA glycosylase
MNKKQVSTIFGPSWVEIMHPIMNSDYMQKIGRTLVGERREFEVFPSQQDMFRAFRETPLDKVKVILIGQDPYHTPGMADGLCFSVRNPPIGSRTPPSLVNILKELEDDLGPRGVGAGFSTDLTPWARQGVLMLNTALSVRSGVADSHRDIGWDLFIRNVLDGVVEARFFPLVFVGWGKKAQAVIDNHLDPFFHHYVKSAHPSPFSAHKGFFGSKPFSKINGYLEQENTPPINWSL